MDDAALRRKVLVTAPELWAMLRAEAPPRVLAVQSVSPYTGLSSVTGFWVPGAVDTLAYTDFAAPAGPGTGDRPLPALADLQAAARRWGLRHGQTIVVYDNDRCLTAARAWWVLRWAGLADVRVLDGGLPAWAAAGLPQDRAPQRPAPSDIVLEAGGMPEFGADEAAEYVARGVLLDARIRPNYIGGAEHGGDPARGHIPGARSAPAPDNLTDPGPFTDAATLREMYAGLGVVPGRPVGVYCGAGMSACHTVLALASIGIEAAMYPGSWSQWVSDPSRPVRRGPHP
jgi:thiosulfate/3-mercaptopyruvate sulfurtransferase